MKHPLIWVQVACATGATVAFGIGVALGSIPHPLVSLSVVTTTWSGTCLQISRLRKR